MARHSPLTSSSYISRSDADPDYEGDLEWPFGRIDSIDADDLRETAYELFFMSCRSSPGFGSGRSTLAFYSAAAQDGGEGGSMTGVVKNAPQGLVGTSRIKKVLGLKARRSSPMRTLHQSSTAAGLASTGGAGGSTRVIKRPMTSAEIMRQQMKVTEQSDSRLRKTLMRTLVGQTGRRAETIILPLELLRQLKPSEFIAGEEYHFWQRRQLKLLEAGLLLYPSIPIERSNAAVSGLREVLRQSEFKAIDTSKNSEAMRTLCNSVLALAWRSSGSAGGAEASCHWADGFPLNVHIYLALLRSIFDAKEETVVLDEVDELLELMKKTWSTLGLNRAVHNVCFSWTLLNQFVSTGQAEHELLCASLVMLGEVSADSRRVEREEVYVRTLSAVLASIQGWADKRLMDYREYFPDGASTFMENVVLLALAAAKIVDEDVAGGTTSIDDAPPFDSSENRVDYYIRSSLRNAFNKTLEESESWGTSLAVEKASELLVELAAETEELAIREKESFSCVLKRWHPVPAAVAMVTLHNCYGVVLKQYLEGVSTLTVDSVRVLEAADKLEKALAQIAVEDSAECDDGGKGIVREMIPYEVDAITSSLTKNWIDDKVSCIRECFQRAKDTETWNSKVKGEAYAQSAAEMMKLATEMVEDYADTPLGFREEMVQYLAEGLGSILQDYTAFVASCGSRRSYIPILPPLTRRNQDSKFMRLWRKAAPCKVGADPGDARIWQADGDHPRPSTSRGTQRLYVRLNTLHYLLSNLRHLDNTLSHASPFAGSKSRRRRPSSFFENVRTEIQSAIETVADVAACRLIFLDSSSSFYDGLYVGDVANARIRPALRNLKQNLTLITNMVTDRAQPLALREVMKASFEAFLMVLLAGGSDRAFQREDRGMIEEDFTSLKRVFAACGEGLVAEEVVQREAEVTEGVVALMGLTTEQLVEDFSAAACESSSLGELGMSAQRLPMPPTTGKWSRSDANTILRVLCHRDDDASNRFLKRTFRMAKRR